MTGTCSAHQGHDPECDRCTAGLKETVCAEFPTQNHGDGEFVTFDASCGKCLRIVRIALCYDCYEVFIKTKAKCRDCMIPLAMLAYRIPEEGIWWPHDRAPRGVPE